VADIVGLAWEPTGRWARVELLIILVEGSRDLADALSDGDLPPTLRREILCETARALRHFHGHGYLHGDLNLKNLLWTNHDGRIEITLIDLDPRGTRLPGSGRSAEGNLVRLYRSVLKGELAGSWQLTVTEVYRFLHEYFRDDRAALRAFWTSANRRRGMTLIRHRISRAAGSTQRRTR
jgi:serine/threonine protein kinase